MNKATADLLTELAKTRLQVSKLGGAVTRLYGLLEQVATDSSSVPSRSCRLCGYPERRHHASCPFTDVAAMIATLKE